MTTDQDACLLAVFLIKLIYVDVLTASRENKVIALKPILRKLLEGPDEELRLSNMDTWFEYCRLLEIPPLVL